MSKHISRKDRWTQRDSRTYTSHLGRVEYRLEAWYAYLSYRLRAPSPLAGELPGWIVSERWLGPCRRPRNAMVELEREIAVLRNRHGDDVQIGAEMVDS